MLKTLLAAAYLFSCNSFAELIITGKDLEILASPISIQESNLTLKSAVEHINQKCGLSVTLDDVAIKKAGIDPSRRFSIKVKDVTVAEAYAQVLTIASPERRLCIVTISTGGVSRFVLTERDERTKDIVILPLMPQKLDVQ